MTKVYGGTAPLQRTLVYLEDDRIEIGRLSFAYTEDLQRVAYRDVTLVLFHAARRWRFLATAIVVGLLAIVSGIVAAAVQSSSGGDRAWLGFFVSAFILVLVAAPLAWFGRKGTATGFRVDGVRTSVASAIGGRRATQERFKLELLSRIEDAKRRAVAASAAAVSAPSTSEAWLPPDAPSAAPESESPPPEPPPPPSA